MQKGDISNQITPRLLVVFEGLLGILDGPKARAKEATARKMHRWKHAVNQYELNDIVARHIWDVTWRKHYSVDVVTFLGVDFALALQDYLDEHQLPVGHIRSSTPDRLARELSYDPSVLAVYDPDPSHVFTYGGKGRILSPTEPNFFGA